MVVEDDPVQRLLITEAVRSAGMTTVEASDGETALAMLADPDLPTLVLVLLDLDLGAVAGLDVLTAIRQSDRHATLPVIVLTGHDDLDELVHGLAAGASDYVGKPVSPRELTARVDAQLRAASTWQQEALDDLRQRRDLAAALAHLSSSADTPRLRDAVVEAITQLPGVRRVDIVGTGGAEGVRRRAPRTARLLSIHGVQALAQGFAGPWGNLYRDEDGLLVGAPFTTPDGTTGLLVVEPDPAVWIPERRLVAMVTDAASLVANSVAERLVGEHVAEIARTRVRGIIDSAAFHPVFQPIMDLRSRRVTGYEALTRFDDGPPDMIFADAAAAGLSDELHEAAIRAVAQVVHQLPRDVYVAVNVSPAVLDNVDFPRWLPRGRRVVVEVTEHEPIRDYATLVSKVAALGPHIEMAVDDAGAGYASLQHILHLSPAIVKLDRSLVAGVHRRPGQEAMVAGLTHFAGRRGVRLVAEGVEEQAEAEMLRQLGVHYGQGWHFGRPQRVEALRSLV